MIRLISKPSWGEPLWGRSRAVDMEMFQFGDRFTVESRRGLRTVGELALHVQSAWRITRYGRVMVGSRDHWSPASGVPDEDFNPDNPGSTRRDELLALFLGHGEETHRVVRATISEWSDLLLQFADGCALDTLSDLGYQETTAQPPAECWRLLRPAMAGEPHLVISDPWRPGATHGRMKIGRLSGDVDSPWCCEPDI